jgi:hypothetical protein
MADNGEQEVTPTPRIAILLSALRAEMGDDPELVKQAFEDTNALERQNHRIYFESRAEYGRLVGQAVLSREASVRSSRSFGTI